MYFKLDIKFLHGNFGEYSNDWIKRNNKYKIPQQKLK